MSETREHESETQTRHPDLVVRAMQQQFARLEVVLNGFSNLSPNVFPDSRTNPFEGGGDDTIQPMLNKGRTLDILKVADKALDKQDSTELFASLEGPMTRGRLQKLQEALLAHFVQPWGSDLMPNTKPKVFNLWKAHFGAEQGLISL